eukprot:285558-Rhodomonas_salina.1
MAMLDQRTVTEWDADGNIFHKLCLCGGFTRASARKAQVVTEWDADCRKAQVVTEWDADCKEFGSCVSCALMCQVSEMEKRDKIPEEQAPFQTSQPCCDQNRAQRESKCHGKCGVRLFMVEVLKVSPTAELRVGWLKAWRVGESDVMSVSHFCILFLLHITTVRQDPLRTSYLVQSSDKFPRDIRMQYKMVT